MESEFVKDIDQEQSPRSTGRIDHLQVSRPQLPGEATQVSSFPPGNTHDRLQEIRERRYTFFIEHMDTLLPLLGNAKPLEKLLSAGNYADARSISFEMLKAQPEGLKASLKPYQLEGLSFLFHLRNNGVGGILADEMGLGKTLQTLSLFQLLKEQDYMDHDDNRPFLVVCPLSILETWLAEIAKWTPELRAMKYHGTFEQRAVVKKALAAQKKPKDHAKSTDMVDIVITSYDTLLSEINWFSRAFIWRYVVLDEGHRIKNSRSKRASDLGRLKSECKLVLSGAPIQNDLGELWSIFHWLYPEIFVQSTEKLFEQAFSLKDGKFDPGFFDNVKKFLRLIMIRRTKDTQGIGLNIPPKTELVLSVPLSKMQSSWYMRVLTGADQVPVDIPESYPLLPGESSGSHASADGSILSSALELPYETSSATADKYRITGNILMELRKCSIHPYLLADAIPESYELGEHIISNSGKFIVLHKLLRHYLEVENTKVIIFSNFEQSLNLCEDLLLMLKEKSRPFEYARLDGRTTNPWRKLMVHLFQSDPRYMVFLVSIRAGGEGLNLTSSSVIVFLDEDWNPQVMRQAESRIHRIGQTQPVTIFKLRFSGTIEEQMSRRIAKKAYIATKVIENMHTPCRDNLLHLGMDSFDTSDLNGLPSPLPSPSIWDAHSLSESQINTCDLAQWDIKTLLENCAHNPESKWGSGHFTAEEEQLWLEKAERVRTDLFNGVRVDTTGRHHSVYAPSAGTSLVRSDRRIGKERTVIIDGYEVSKESLDPKLAELEPRSKDTNLPKDELIHELTCFICRRFNPVSCDICPRSFHKKCLENITRKEESSEVLVCPQHYCWDCGKSASQAGRLLFPCTHCVKAFCEECLNWEHTTFVGGNPEYEGMGYNPNNAFDIKCIDCRGVEKRQDISDAQLDVRKRRKL